MWLKQSTSVVVPVGPFVAQTDGVTLKTGLASAIDHASTGIMLSKNGGSMAVRHATVTTSVYDAYGMYKVTLDTTDTNTLGTLRLSFADATTNLPVWQDFMVLPATVYDALFASSGGGMPIDWGAIINKTTSNALTGTTIATTQKVDIDTIKTNAVVNGGTITFPTNATLASTTNITAAAGCAVSSIGTDVITDTSLATTAVNEIRNAITGGSYALSTDANGRIRIVDGTSAGEVDTASGLVSLTSSQSFNNTGQTTSLPATLSNSVTHGGAAAVLQLERFIAVSTTTNEPGMKVSGNGTAPGARFDGGATGHGLGIYGGATSGRGIDIGTTNGIGIAVDAFGSGKQAVSLFSEQEVALYAQGTYAGFYLYASDVGSTPWGQPHSGAIVLDIDGDGGQAIGIDGGSGLSHGVRILASGANKDAILLTGGTGGYGFNGTLSPSTLASLFLTNSGSVFSAAVDGSAVKEIAKATWNNGAGDRTLTALGFEIAAIDFDVGAIDANALGADAVAEIRDAITGGGWALSTDSNGRVRIVDGTGAGEIDTNAGAISLVTTVTNLINAATAGDLTTTMKASVNSEVLDVFAVDTYPLPGQVTPSTTPTLAQAIMQGFQQGTNPYQEDSSEQRLYNRGGTIVHQKRTVSDSSGITSLGALVTGP